MSRIDGSMSEDDFWIKDNRCRLCLINGAKICIFEEKTVLSNIMTYCKLEVMKDDGLPSFICSNCILKVEDLSKFIAQCHENERILRDNIELQNSHENKILFYDNGIEDFGDHIDNFNYKENFEIPKKLYDEDEEKNLMESIQISESGEEFLYYLGIKIIVNRTTMQKFKEKRRGVKRHTLCPICGKLVTKCLATHMQTHDEKIHTCEICSKAFPLKEKLKLHLRAHSEIRNFECSECSKRFKRKDQLKKHIYSVHYEPLIFHSCNLCDRKFKHACGLKHHLKTHSGEKNHQCQICNKKFTEKSSLTIHMRVHTGEKPFSCKYCNKSFSMSKSLKDHERLHTGEKPYECSVCDKGFMQLSNMKSHFRNNHKGVEFKKKIPRKLLNKP